MLFSTRRPIDPVSSRTWSIVAHADVEPGEHTVTVTYATLTAPSEKPDADDDLGGVGAGGGIDRGDRRTAAATDAASGQGRLGRAAAASSEAQREQRNGDG
jgi:hypothetical protein